MKKQITSTEVETVIKNLPTNRSPWPEGFTGKVYQNVKEELTPILLELFQKTAKGGKLSNSFYKATIILIPKLDKDTTKKRKLQASIIDEHGCKNPQQNSSKQIQQHIKRTIPHDQVGFYPSNVKILQYTQTNQCDTPY